MRTLIAAALLAIAGTPAVACSFVPSELSWWEQVQLEDRIFIGTILMIDPDKQLVLFAVDEPIRGVDSKWIEVPQGDGANCNRMYHSAGTQWIYAGDFIGGPTWEIPAPFDDEELAALESVRKLAEEN
jgi:hypothetical protein